jgi:protein TonB
MLATLPRLARRSGGAVALAAAALLAPRAAAAQGEIHGSEDLSSAPKLVSPAMAARLVARSFPEEMRRTSTGGTVQLEFVVGANGKVEPGSVEVVQAPAPALGNAARAVVEKMEFVPGKKDGTAVRSRVQLPIVYRP